MAGLTVGVSTGGSVALLRLRSSISNLSLRALGRRSGGLGVARLRGSVALLRLLPRLRVGVASGSSIALLSLRTRRGGLRRRVALGLSGIALLRLRSVALLGLGGVALLRRSVAHLSRRALLRRRG